MLHVDHWEACNIKDIANYSQIQEGHWLDMQIKQDLNMITIIKL